MKQRLYHVDAINDRTGFRQRQTAYPMPHDEACRFASKQSDGSKRAGVRFPLVQAAPCDTDHACEPYTSYRLRSPYGWILIGAMDADDAMRQAARSTRNPDRAALEVWNGSRYIPA